MNCPVDGTMLTMADRQGIEIDYCPKCRGVWLDRGELDKIIERSSTAPEYDEPRRFDNDDERRRYDDEERRRYEAQGKPYKKKRKSIFEDLFDFG
jgi:Zn-finger nucleic acid-binding protein